MKNFISTITDTAVKVAGGGRSRGDKKLFRPDRKFVHAAESSEMQVQGLHVHIKNNHILKDVNLTLPDRRITCVIGPSGCGKTDRKSVV